MAGKVKPGFYIAVFLVIAGLVAFAFVRYGRKDKGEEASGGGDDIKLKSPQAEAPSTDGITTVKEYTFEPASRLPEVKGTSDYAKMDDRTVKFAINVWAGWAPILHANQGLAAGKVWKDANGKEFKVELVLLDDPVNMRDTFAIGKVHIGWATVDMLPLLVQGLWKDTRTRPRVFQQVDWSNSGDGIVVRDDIKSAADLRGKKVAYAANSPSHFFLLNVLLNAGVQPSEIESKTTPTAFEAAAAFAQRKNGISAMVSWAPDIYKLAEQKGNRMLVTTETANKLIADVWFARADFAKDHPEIIEGLVRGIFDAMVELEEKDEAKQSVAKIMAKAYGIKAEDAVGMLADAHSTNFAENREFFLNSNNPTNFKATYESAHHLYQQIRGGDGKPLVGQEIPFDKIVDFSVIKKLTKVPKYANQQDTYKTQFTPTSASSVQGAEKEIIAKLVTINFFPNSFNLDKKISQTVNGKTRELLYDPAAPLVVEEIGKLAGQYGAAIIVIEGHTDASMKGRVDPSLVKDLSAKRAAAVKQAVVRRYPTLSEKQFKSVGKGWEVPADLSNPGDHVKNRRVEVKVYPAEVQ